MHPDPTGTALRALLAYVRNQYEPVGIVVSGSIVRGDPGPHSDYDVFVVHEHPWRLRDQQRFEGVPAELFVNPPAAVRGYFAREHAQARPCTAHMLATGQLIDGAAPVVHALVAEARDWLARPPPPPDLEAMRYFAVDLLDDARDAEAAGDRAAALLLLSRAVDGIVEVTFRARGRTLPRRKRAVAELASLDAEAALLVERFATGTVAERLPTVVALADRVLGASTFFAWTSARDPVADLHEA